MFKGLHNVLQKTKMSEATPKHPDVHFVQSAEALLVTEKRQEYLKNIKSLLNLPPKLYDALYYKVIKQFAEFVQTLPETQHGIFSSEGGFLDHGLERASRALSLCLSYFFPQEKNFQAVSSQEALWIYAVFTAALLLDIGKIAVKYEVEICDKAGTFVKDWQLYSSAMTKQGKFYKFNFVKRNLDNLRRLITGLLARQLLDLASEEDGGTNASGFTWIASNPDVLETWLTILQGEKRFPISSYLSVIPLADAYIVENYFLNKSFTQPYAPNTLFDTPQTPTEGIYATADLGQAFLQWLRDKLAKGNITINQLDSDAHVVEEGALLNPALFEKFTQEVPAFKNIKADMVEKQFRQVLEVFWDTPANLQSKYIGIMGITAQQLHRFILVARLDILFPPGSKHPLSAYAHRAPAETNTLAQEPQLQTPKDPTMGASPKLNV